MTSLHWWQVVSVFGTRPKHVEVQDLLERCRRWIRWSDTSSEMYECNYSELVRDVALLEDYITRLIQGVLIRQTLLQTV